jgi:MoaA/NifB/PqqE/SkfB family radical SAM enzyme
MAMEANDPRKRDNFCPIPFLQLQLNPFGDVSACCFSGEHKVGSVREHTLAQIWNGEEIKKWRREFLSGEISICKGPMSSFSCHKNYVELKPLVELAEIQPGLPRRLDLRLNGKCNLECVMCDVWKQPNHIYDQSDFWTIGPEKIFPNLVEVDMLGGEPFIQRDTFRFIDEVLKVNDQCTWGFITNGQYNFNEKLSGVLNRLKLRHIHISVDSINPDTYPKIRRKGDFNRMMNTLMDFVAYRNRRANEGRPFSLMASMCIQSENWNELPDFLDFCERYEISPILQNMIVGEASHRNPHSLQFKSDEEKREISAFFVPFLSGRHAGAVGSIISSMNAKST